VIAVAASELVFPVRRLAPGGLEAWAQVIERGYAGYVAKDEASVLRLPSFGVSRPIGFRPPAVFAVPGSTVDRPTCVSRPVLVAVPTWRRSGP
jgi:hypothetical protein